MELECMGPAGDAPPCPRPPLFAAWCDCPAGASTLACALFFFCAECLELDLARDPHDFVFEIECVGGGQILLRPRAKAS